MSCRLHQTLKHIWYYAHRTCIGICNAPTSYHFRSERPNRLSLFERGLYISSDCLAATAIKNYVFERRVSVGTVIELIAGPIVFTFRLGKKKKLIIRMKFMTSDKFIWLFSPFSKSNFNLLTFLWFLHIWLTLFTSIRHIIYLLLSMTLSKSLSIWVVRLGAYEKKVRLILDKYHKQMLFLRLSAHMRLTMPYRKKKEQQQPVTGNRSSYKRQNSNESLTSWTKNS